ncbi:UDP-3-O-[3-hydroxymyristoyl] N-acetylglucosamine deacetylase [Candidatus Sumerlaeota bacterium]|nr:UDP-3-O-[3-hydroxymyristoyl] N-acetylglucosamine deacetylase [Candidatus Sumerlaeota bacterium]
MGTTQQQTVERPAEAEGVGVHTGRRSTLRIEPAGPDAGIVFVRSDLSGEPTIAVHPRSVNRAALQRMTVLQSPSGSEGEATVAMPEHLLATCSGLRISNLRVVLNGPECPIFDGSAEPYVRLIHEAGIRPQAPPARAWRLKRTVALLRDGAELIAVPADRMRLTFFAEFRHAGLPDQQVTFEPGRDDFASQIAPARTFCFWEEIEALRKDNLIQGGSLDCAIVLRDGKPVQGDFRFDNELARHKLLDLMGDLAVLGGPVLALISARSSGHALHHEFIGMLEKELTDA